MTPWLRWTALAGLVLVLILVPFALWEDSLNAVSARLLVPTAGRLVLATAVVFLLTADVLLPVPSSFVSAGAIALLGALAGGVTVALGMTLGGWLGYFLGRWGGEPLAARIAGATELARARGVMAQHGSWLVLACRGVPVLAEASTLLAGATRLSPLRFALATTLGNVGLACAYASVGVLELSRTGALLAPFVLGVAVPGAFLLALRALTRR